MSAAIIGSGVSGTVRGTDTTVEKTVQSARHALAEERAAAILRRVDPDQEHTIYGTEITHGTSGTTVRMTHGGVDLGQFVDSVWLLQYGKKEDVLARARSTLAQFKDQMPRIFSSFRDLIAWLPAIHAAGIAHSDIQPSNLVWDGTQLRMIDWGYATFADAPDFARETSADIEGLTEVLEDMTASANTVYKAGGRRRTRKTRKARS